MSAKPGRIISAYLLLVSLLAVILGVLAYLFIHWTPHETLIRNFQNLFSPDLLSGTILLSVFLIICIWILNPDEVQKIRELDLEKCPPRRLVRMQKFRGIFPRFFQMISYHCGNRFVYFVLFLISTAVIILVRMFHGEQPDAIIADLLSFTGLLYILFLYVLILGIFWILKYRAILVIDNFEDFISDTDTSPGKGIAQLLLVELNKISQLYSDVSEQRPIATSTGEARAASALIKVDDPGESLSQAVASSSTVKIASIEFPLGLFVSMFNVLGRGPRIRGSIRKAGDGSLLLVASSSGFQRNFGWKVTSIVTQEKRRLIYPDDEDPTGSEIPSATTPGPDGAEKPKPLPLEKMVHELACRILTDIPSTGSFRWEATMFFNRGLFKYRECLQTPKEQTKNFQKAEEYFQKALVYDNKFISAWYNLGVIYSELGWKSAANHAFSRSIELDQNQPGAYYGYALNAFDRLSHETSQESDPSELYLRYEKELLTYCMQVEKLHSSFSHPFRKTVYRMYDWQFSCEYLGLEARNYHLMGLAFLDVVKKCLDHTKKRKKPEPGFTTKPRVCQPCLDTTRSDQLPRVPIDEKEVDRLVLQCISQTTLYQKKAVIAAWTYYSQTPHLFGADRNYYQKRHWIEVCRLLGLCIMDLGWMYLYRGCISPLSPDNNELRSQETEWDDADYLFTTARNLNSLIKSECICAEIHWSKGILDLCRADPKNEDPAPASQDGPDPHQLKNQDRYEYPSVQDGFLAALRISPGRMKYHMACALYSRMCMPAASVSAKNYPVSAGLEYAIGAYKNEYERTDDQWKSLEDLHTLLSLASHVKPDTRFLDTVKDFFASIQDIHEFIRHYYFLEQLLDFYTCDYEGNLFDCRIRIQICNCERELENCRKKACGPAESSLDYGKIADWMEGQIYYLKGRWKYLQADYGKWFCHGYRNEKFILADSGNFHNITDEVFVEDPFSEKWFGESETCFLNACKYFDQFPREREKIYPRISLIQTFRKRHNYRDAFFNGSMTHALNPVGQFEHVILGMLAMEINDYEKARDYFLDALLRAYDVPDFPQYLMNQYYRKISLAFSYLADKECDKSRKRDLYCRALEILSEASHTFAYGYDNTIGADDTLIDTCLINEPVKQKICKKLDMPRPFPLQCLQIPSADDLLCQKHILRRLKATEFLKRMMAIHVRRGKIFTKLNQPEKADLEYTIVNTIFSPPLPSPEDTPVGRICDQRIRSSAIKEWSGWREYIITLYLLAELSFNLGKFDETRSYLCKLKKYEELMIRCCDHEPVWERLWTGITPREILIDISIWEMKIEFCFDNVQDPTLESRIRDVQTHLGALMEFNKTCCIYNEVIRENIREIIYQRSVAISIIRCQWEIKKIRDTIPHPESGNPAPVPSASAESLNSAFSAYEKSIQDSPRAGCLVGMLRILERFLDDPKFIKEIRAVMIEKAGSYASTLENLGVPEEDKDFFDAVSKKLGELQRPKTPGNGKKTPVFCCFVP